MDLSLCPLSKTDYDRVRHIAVAPEQIVYSGTVAMAFSREEEAVDFHGIRASGVFVGFFKIDRAFAQSHPFAQMEGLREGHREELGTVLGLRAFMIDKRFQNRGYGTGAARKLAQYLPPLYPKATSLMLTANLRNPLAIRTYKRAGFADTGEIHQGGLGGPQIVMRLPLRLPPHLPRRLPEEIEDFERSDR